MSAAKRKTVLVVLADGGGHYPQGQLMGYLQEAGHRIVIARKGGENQDRFDSVADDVLDVDVYNPSRLSTDVAEYRRSNAIDGAVTVNEFAVEQTAVLCAALGLRGLNPTAATQCRNKYLTRIALERRGVDQARFALVRSSRDVAELGDRLGYPYIVKPMNYGGSYGILKIESPRDAQELAGRLGAMRDEAPAYFLPNDHLPGYWIAEQYLSGMEICAECVVDDGRCSVIAIHDKMVPNDSMDFLEQYAVTPSPRIDAALEVLIVARCAEVLEAVGYDNGVAHLEFRIAERGPLLLEANARIGGALIAASTLNSTGIRLAECLVKIALNEPLDLTIPSRTPTAFCVIYTGAGTVQRVHGADAVRNMQGVRMFEQFVHEGDIISHAVNGDGAIVLFEAETSQEVFDRASTAVATMRYELE